MNIAPYLDSLNLPPGETIAVALSGGADSLCLTMAIKDYIKGKKIKLVALTVDHKLRPESTIEAKSVARQMKKMGIKHCILTWRGAKPQTRIEETARAERYRLMTDYCHQNGIKHLFLGHHQNDNVETFLFRLSKASGLTGLAGMRRTSVRDGIVLCRPLLDTDKVAIIAYLKKRHITWVDDPMNEDVSFERVKWRNSLPVLKKMGLIPALMGRSITRLARADAALEKFTDNFISSYVHIDDLGYAQVDPYAYKIMPDEVKIRTLMRLIARIGGIENPVSLDGIEGIAATTKPRTTLGNCYVIRRKDGIFIAKESVRMEGTKTVPAKRWTTWDRFNVYTSVPAIIAHRSSKMKECDLPLLVQQSFPRVTDKKGVEIYPGIDYKERKYHIDVRITFKK